MHDLKNKMKLKASEVVNCDDTESKEHDDPKGPDVGYDEIEDDNDDSICNDVDDDPNDYVDKVENGDTQRVIGLRILLILSLATSATVMSYFVHKYIATHEEKQFHDKFYNDANKVLEAVGSSLERTLTTLNAIALAYVSHVAISSDSNDANTTWPFVTLPNFALHASKLLPLTNGLFVSMHPVVCPSQKAYWEEYSLQNDYWVNETLNLQEVWDRHAIVRSAEK